MYQIKVLLKQLNEKLEIPSYAKPDDAGVDLRANIGEPKVLAPGERWLCPTGIAVYFEPGYQAEVRPRSGLALKNGITIVNSPGTIDSGYINEIGVILLNTSEKAFRIEPGDRIAQLVFMPVVQAKFEVVDKLPESVRGMSGFGDSGVK